MEESQILKFYKSCNVFITGGTGFMGKILIEKLLRTTEVSTLYILVREKKGKNAYSRLEDLFEDMIFDKLKKDCPKFKHRIEAIPGDCTLSGLGLSIIDRQKLTSCIDIIFHVAATVKFDENLKLAYQINVNATKDVLDLARETKNLKSIIHVSTAFSNCPYKTVEEKIYDHPVYYDNVRAVIEKISNNEANVLTPKILGKWPNTYTFTKALAESLIKDTGNGLPLGIYRPAIVISTFKEPVEGWIDNLYGPTGICVGVLSGVLRVMLCDKNVIADLVPVDTCVAGLIASAWDVANKECERIPENIPVYNYVSSSENPLRWNEFVAVNTLHGRKMPYLNALWTTFVLMTSNFYMYQFLTFILQTIPALFIDFGLLITGHKPRMLQMYKRVDKLICTLSHFSRQEWKFVNDNVVKLWNKMGNRDQELFPLSIKNVHWLIYFQGYMKGVRKYMLKDPDSTLEAARKRDRRFLIASYTLAVACIYIGCNIAISILCRVFSLFF